MPIRPYSSLAAFLAHLRALESSTARSAAEERQLAEMRSALDALRPALRASLDADSSEPAARRHRERAELALARELRARGWMHG